MLNFMFETGRAYDGIQLIEVFQPINSLKVYFRDKSRNINGSILLDEITVELLHETQSKDWLQNIIMDHYDKGEYTWEPTDKIEKILD